MERETEMTQSRTSAAAAAAAESGGGLLAKGLQQPTNGGLSFKLPALDDDGTDISLKEWQPAPFDMLPRLPGGEKEAHGNGFFKGSVRTRYTQPLEPQKDDDDNDHDGFHGAAADGAAVQGGGGAGRHQPNISLVNGIAAPPPPPSSPRGGIAFDIVNFDNDKTPTPRPSRGNSLRVSFIDDVVIGSPSPPRLRTSKLPSQNQTTRPNNQRPKSNPAPPWESSTKIGTAPAPAPKKFVQPTLHGIKVKKSIVAVKQRAFPAAPEVEAEDEHPRNKDWAHRAGRAPDAQFPGGEYDSASKLISTSLVVSPAQSRRRDDAAAPAAAAAAADFLPRSYGVRRYEEEREGEDSEEDVKVSMLCGGGITEPNRITGDFGRFFSKLRRASVPQTAGPVSKTQPAAYFRAPSDAANKIARAHSTPIILSKSSLDSSLAAQNYAIGRHASLKLLQECCLTETAGSIPAYGGAGKPRKTRDHEPHRHYYKTISKTLDQKLKS